MINLSSRERTQYLHLTIFLPVVEMDKCNAEDHVGKLFKKTNKLQGGL